MHTHIIKYTALLYCDIKINWKIRRHHFTFKFLHWHYIHQKKKQYEL